MEDQELGSAYRWAGVVMILGLVAGISLSAGILWSSTAKAAESKNQPSKKVKVIYQRKTQLDFEGAAIEGELKKPNEFYFQHKPQDQFDSLVQRRKNFHQEMLRDVVLSK